MGGHLGLDLVYTVEPRFRPLTAASTSSILTPSWCGHSGCGSSATPRLVRSVRHGPRHPGPPCARCMRSSRFVKLCMPSSGSTGRRNPTSESPDGELEFLAQRYAAALGGPELRLQTRSGPADPSTGPGPSARVTGSPAVTATRLVIGSSPGSLIPDRVVGTSVELICETDLSPLRSCPEGEGGCGWLFLDHSRNHSRRWCEIGGECATQAKVRRLTERRRAARRRAVKG